MSALMQMLASQLGEGSIQQIGARIGADPRSTQRAVEAALPALLGGLAHNANASPEGARSLAGALDRDHDGSVLDDLGGLLGAFGGGRSSGRSGGAGLDALVGAAGQLFGQKAGGGSSAPRALDGQGILGHVFGARQSQVETQVSRASGLDLKQVQALLPLLAPLVMSALAKLKQRQSLDAEGLARTLDQERAQVRQQAPQAGGLLDLLDRDRDGSVADDLTELGSGLLGQFLSRKR